jgi:hypothetical protein
LTPPPDNPVRALATQPTSSAEHRRLNGKIASLNRFRFASPIAELH